MELAEHLRCEGASLEWDTEPADPQARIDADEKLAEEMFSRPAGARALRVWRNVHALVIPRRFSRHDGFDAAAARSPLPVLTRKSGGTAVVHGPHIVNISLALSEPRSTELSMGRLFTQLGEVMVEALAPLGVQARLGDVAGAHCPGRYTLQSRGRKLAGTAAFVRKRGDLRVAMVHANLALDTHPSDLDAIMAFEASMDFGELYDPAVHTDLLREIAASRR